MINDIKKCTRCGKTFPRKRGQIFCSKECRKMLMKELQLFGIDWRKEKECDVCKKKYIIKSTNQRFCSRECCNTFYSFDYQSTHNNASGFMKLRFEVFKRDNFTCQYCGRNVKDDKIKLHCDHINPKHLGGDDNIENLTTSCEQCNLGKGCAAL